MRKIIAIFEFVCLFVCVGVVQLPQALNPKPETGYEIKRPTVQSSDTKYILGG
jgi:hypothetical protein